MNRRLALTDKKRVRNGLALRLYQGRIALADYRAALRPLSADDHVFRSWLRQVGDVSTGRSTVLCPY